MSATHTVVFDGHCRICTRMCGVLAQWDKEGRLEIIPSQTPGLETRFPWIPAQAYRDALQVVGKERQTWEGAAAIEELLSVLPRGALVAWLFELPFARPLANRFYRWFARNRYRLGCGDHCSYQPRPPSGRLPGA